MATSFTSLALRPELLEALDQLAWTQPTPIQADALPLLLQGVDVVGHARTGSGKTGAFGLGLLQRLDPDLRTVQALVLCPTRELADQVADDLRRLASRLPDTRVLSICGGRVLRDQRAELAQGAQIVVGTPGRINDHLDRDSLDLSDLSVLVLDEADRMLDMGFIDQVRQVIARCPGDRQTLLFSATFPPQIQELSAQVQRDPRSVSVATRVDSALLQQRVIPCDASRRFERIGQLLAEHRPEAALIFCETRGDCDDLAAWLHQLGAPALVLHGGLEQRDRDDVLLQFANGSVRLLVATDIAARGLDIESLPLVIIAELSPEPENHVHRIGRTGRAGEAGLALSIVCGGAEHARLARIEAFLGETIPVGGGESGKPQDPTAGRPDPVAGGTDLTFLTPAWRTVLLLSGRKDKLRKGDVLGALVKDVGLPPDAIGRIDLSARSCAVAIARDRAPDAAAQLRRGRVKNKRVRVVLLG